MKAVALADGSLGSVVLTRQLKEQSGCEELYLVSHLGLADYDEMEVAETREDCARKLAGREASGWDQVNLNSIRRITEVDGNPKRVNNWPVLLITICVAKALSVRADTVALPYHWDSGVGVDVGELVEAYNHIQSPKALDAASHISQPYVVAPLSDLQLHEVVERGEEMDAPWRLSWSCTRRADYHCGECAGCENRKFAFEIAEVEDPQPFATAEAER